MKDANDATARGRTLAEWETELNQRQQDHEVRKADLDARIAKLRALSA